jgi:hypothetical protein
VGRTSRSWFLSGVIALQIARALKPIYTIDADGARAELEGFDEKWHT